MDTLYHTYSIVARDEKTGQLGVAVQSHWFNVGSLCPWVEAGVGAIATQSLVKVSYGPEGLDLLRAGKSAQEALDIMLAEDKDNNVRQVAIVDARGNIATHTGSHCIAQAGHIKGNSFSVQANMMKNDSVWPAMAKAYEESQGDLTDRMLAAMLAAQAEGGDIRGKQSAAMLIADATKSDTPYEHLVLDLRVEDDPDPLTELKRLIDIQRAYDHMNQGDEYLSQHDMKNAMHAYAQAARLAPHIEELRFWEAATLAENGKLAEALPIFKDVFAINPDWAVLLQRLPASGLFPDDKELLNTILQQAK